MLLGIPLKGNFKQGVYEIGMGFKIYCHPVFNYYRTSDFHVDLIQKGSERRLRNCVSTANDIESSVKELLRAEVEDLKEEAFRKLNEAALLDSLLG
jgi:hypothetical protein